MVNGTVLIIDDNPNVRSALEILLLPEYKSVLSLDSPDKINTIDTLSEVDLVLLDMNFTSKTKLGTEGLFWLSELKKDVPEIKIIMITAYGDVELAVKAIKNGANDFILKPWKNEQLLTTLKTAYLQKKATPIKTAVSSIPTPSNLQSIIGNSNSIQQTLELVKKISKINLDVLIYGENGTGKELLAKELHKNSAQKNEKFVPVDLAALLENNIEAELFGKTSGSTGKLGFADNGILFINAIDKLPLNTQSKLLHVLQEKKITPVGSTNEITINIRLVAATKVDLSGLVKQGQFREDLLYHINTVNIEVPPLRNRGSDILLLTDHYIEKFKTKYQKKELQIHSSAKQKLQTYSWPGNVRELKHVLERAVILSTGLFVRDEDLKLQEQVNFRAQNPITLSEMELVMIEKALSDHQGNYSAAANQLGISRQTLYNKMKKLSTND